MKTSIDTALPVLTHQGICIGFEAGCIALIHAV